MTPEEKRQRATACPDRPLSGAKVGWVVGLSADGSAKVDFDGNPHGPLEAPVACGIARQALEAAAAAQQRAVLLFDDSDRTRPLLMALLQPTGPGALLEEVLSTTESPEPSALKAEVEADGQKLAVEARDEIVLRCGKASITLQRNGKIVLRGTHLESHSEGTNRIKGATIKLN